MRVLRALIWARAGAVLAVLIGAQPLVRGQSSPCPDIFSYTQDGGATVGEIEIPKITYGKHTLKVDMSIKALLPTSYKGELKLLNQNDLLRAIKSSGSVFYRVIFPVTSPLPKITSISFDGNIICRGSPENFSTAVLRITDISLTHTLRANLKTPVNSPDAECGVSQIQSTQNFIVGGQATSPGDWPWLAALYLKAQREYICTGSLVSSNVVITAAHCLYAKKRYAVTAFLVELGVHDRTVDEDSNKQTRELLEIKLTDGHGGIDNNNIEDVTALVLDQPVVFTKFIQPICLWGGNKSLRKIVGRDGLVIGWGADELGNPATPKPMLVKIPIVSNEQCRVSSQLLSNVDDKTQFCAGTKDPKKGPCAGDSGAGLVLWTGEHYELRGVVSFSLGHQTRACDLSNYIVFCDAAKFASWIQGVITTYKD